MDNENKEKLLYEYWEKQKLFKADLKSSKPAYSLLMPPPNLTGDLHLGHAMQHSILDAVARYKRMQGFDVLLLPGVDHAGIQFEGTFDKILAKNGLSKHKLGRDEWLKKAWQFRDEVYASFHNAWTMFGVSADWEREVFTLDPKVKQSVLTEFQTFWDENLLYKGAYIVQWCPKCGTAIEDIEMEYEEKTEKLYFIKYLIPENGEYITIATARPETIFADVAIAIHPNHPKYKHLVGKNAINPLNLKNNTSTIKIITDKRVDIKFGTGALKVTPGHDPLDYEISKDHGLPILHAIDKTGQMSELAGNLAGMKINESRKMVVQMLEEKGAIEKIENYTHSVPACERCKTTVEPLISEEWFVKMKPLAKKAIDNIDKISFYPTSYKKILTDWMKNIHDWSISRSLWWGHRIPVWYCLKCNPNRLAGKDKDMIISSEVPVKNCQTCNEKHWVQDEQVLDTWFSSGMWPLATLSWPNNTPELNRYFPWGFEITAPEIKYLWIARMIMLSLWFKDSIPFNNMFFHGMIRDIQGRKFSKSLGNGIDPKELRVQWGTDATRMALYTYSAPGRDGRASRQTMDDRCKNFRNFGNKLKNIYKFTVDLKPNDTTTKQSKHKDDKWIIDELNQTIKTVTRHIERFDLHLATEEIYNFTWHKLADIYIEKSKTRRTSAQPTLEHVLESVLILLHPFMPFLTEELWQNWGKQESIMKSSWPNNP